MHYYTCTFSGWRFCALTPYSRRHGPGFGADTTSECKFDYNCIVETRYRLTDLMFAQSRFDAFTSKKSAICGLSQDSRTFNINVLNFGKGCRYTKDGVRT